MAKAPEVVEVAAKFMNRLRNTDGSCTDSYQVDANQISAKSEKPLLMNSMLRVSFTADPLSGDDAEGQEVFGQDGPHVETVGESKGFRVTTSGALSVAFKARDDALSLDAVQPLREKAGRLTLEYVGQPEERRGRPKAGDVNGQETMGEDDEL